MQNRAIHVMQDQVHDRVYSIMAYDFRHPEQRRTRFPARMLVGIGLTALYIAALAVSA